MTSPSSGARVRRTYPGSPPRRSALVPGSLVLVVALIASAASGRAAGDRQEIESQVAGTIRAVMAKHHVPGMAVGVIAGGKSYVFDYGVASLETRQPVTEDTLFEVGSISKTFTATLASLAQVGGKLSLSDKTSEYLPSLRGAPFGDVSLLNLGTHTPGGLPLQMPDGVHNIDQLMRYFKAWRPTCIPGTCRTYANPGIGTLGLITAKSLGGDFATLIERRLFGPLGMTNSFIDVPAAQAARYAQGYTKDGAPVRMSPGVLGAEAYGIRTTASDLLRFVAANMRMVDLDGTLQRAITETHIGYFQAGVMTQDLIWEQYPYPVALKTLLAGNSPAMIFEATPVTEIRPAQKPMEGVWINKTGSTNGFGAYVAFVPEKQLGIVIMGNKNWPIEERVRAAFEILAGLASRQGGSR